MTEIIENNIMKAKSDTAELEKIRAFVSLKAEEFGFSSAESQKIALAVDEACSNLIKHSYKYDSSKSFCLEVETINNYFTVKISDKGIPFNPMAISSPDMEEYFRTFKRGGLGIHIMKLVMDNISYLPSDEKNPYNLLKLTKELH